MVSPSLGVPGGELTILCKGFRPDLLLSSKVLFGETEANIVSASQERVIVRIPDKSDKPGVSLRVGTDSSEVHPFTHAGCLASGLHPVTNPVIAPDGSIITTISGSRGQQVAQPVVRIRRSGEKVPLSCEIMNPTGLAFDREGRLFISSRNDGVVYRYTESEELEVVADELGIACGIIFDSKNFLYVGDRSGKIYRIDPSGNREEFALLEPSVSAYHLAMDSLDRLYVTGPTFSMRDSLYRISAQGKSEVLLRGLARPQGMAFLPDGQLLVATSYEGKKGIFRFDPATLEVRHHIAAPTLVGVATSGEDIFLADSSSIYWIRQSGQAASLN
ncbi:MAG TPA: gluconolaconase [Acidobacteriota bacterium]|nr:gluconolaconase [Acidobacteriota bacterium]